MPPNAVLCPIVSTSFPHLLGLCNPTLLVKPFEITCHLRTGEPWEIKKAVCLHEEDAGIMWKHMEYRNGHAEVRRSRRLVLSFVSTVVNYE